MSGSEVSRRFFCSQVEDWTPFDTLTVVKFPRIPALLLTSLCLIFWSPGLAQLAPTVHVGGYKLRDFFKEALQQKSQGKDDAVLASLQSFVLPEESRWFLGRFSEKRSEDQEAWYTEVRPQLPQLLADSLARAVNEKQMDVEVFQVPGPCVATLGKDGAPTRYLHLLKESLLFEVQMSKGGDKPSRYLRYFTYEDGALRFVGPLPLEARPPAKTEAPAQNKEIHRVRVGGNVMQAKLIDIVRPKYPAEAKARGVQGTVRLMVIIGKDGVVQEIEITTGDRLLSYSAVEAVCGWRYQPTLLNGNPIEVVTTVDVVFSLYK
jgi:TonB family protein